MQMFIYKTVSDGLFDKILIFLSDFSQFINEMIGELFIPHDMPEPPKESFFKGLFGGGARSLDREELCKFYCQHPHF